MVEVFFWEAHEGCFGHVAMKVTGGVPPGEVYLSRFPITSAGDARTRLLIMSIGVATVSKAYEDDVRAEGNMQPTGKVQMYNLDETAIKKKIQETNGGRYEIFVSNCATTVRTCMDAGIPFGKAALLTAGGLSTGLIPMYSLYNSPRGVYSYARVVKGLVG
jgi:hypothetical protein